MHWNDDEQFEGPAPTASRRQQGGGATAVLRLLAPVVMGGVTVFGVYFLFLEDRLKKPPQPAAAESEAKIPKRQTPEREDSAFRRAQRASDSPARSKPKTIAERLDSRTVHPAVPRKETAAQREVSAKNLLRLAGKMLETRPSAAPEWYRKVVERYPGTKAALEAEAWLRKQAGEP